MQIKTGWSTSPPPDSKPSIMPDDDEEFGQLKTAHSHPRGSHGTPPSVSQPSNRNEIRTTSSPATSGAGGKLSTPSSKSITSVKSIPSSKPVATKSIKIKSKPQLSHNFDDCSYDSLLQSYSDEANLCSTPEIRDIYIASAEPAGKKLAKDAKRAPDQPSGKCQSH